MDQKYIVIELQTMSDGTISNITHNYDNFLQAESAYYAILSAAAVSTVPVHAAIMITNKGEYMDAHYYEHN